MFYNTCTMAKRYCIVFLCFVSQGVANDAVARARRPTPRAATPVWSGFFFFFEYVSVAIPVDGLIIIGTHFCKHISSEWPVCLQNDTPN